MGNRNLTILLCAGFILIGIVTVLLGQVLPVLSLHLSLNDRQAGYLFIGQFVGSLAGNLLYGRVVRKYGYPRMLFSGFCLMALGCFGVIFDSWFGLITAISTYGVGIGLTIPPINMLAVELNHDRSASALNTLNFFWGAGAILCKPFVDLLGTPTTVTVPTVVLGGLLFSVGVLIARSGYRGGPRKSEDKDNTEAPIPVWTTKSAWLVAIFNFILIGVESSVGGWITTYQERLTQSSSRGWISAALVFFLLLVIGRGIAPFFFRILTENTVLLLSLVTMTCGIVLILSTNTYGALLAGAATLGFGCSSVFPTNISRFTKLFGPNATQNATPIFVLGGLGGAFIAWLVGVTSTTFESLRAGFSVILVSCVLLIVLQIILAVKSK